MNISIERKKIIIFFKFLIIILILATFIGFLQYLGLNIFVIRGTERMGVKVVRSIFAHHGVFGSLMAFGIGLSIGLKLSTKKNYWTISTIIFAIGLILSSVRRSLIGLSFGLILLSFFSRKFEIEKKYIYGFLGGLIFLAILFGGRFAKITEATKLEYGANIAPRYWLYYGAIRIAMNKPILGEGPGKYGSFISVITKSEIYEKYGINIEDDFKMDAYWANILGEYGILGIIIMLALLISLFRILIENCQQENKNKFIKGLYIGYIIIFVDFALESLLAPVYSSSITAFLLFAGIGIIINGHKYNLKN
jgi:hypothetical protein